MIGAGLNRLSAAADANGGLGAHATAGGDGPNNLVSDAGEAYIVFGALGQRPATIDLRTPPPSAAIIWGAASGDAWGEELFGGDFNGDGYGDVLVGALTAEGLAPNSFNAGQRRRRVPTIAARAIPGTLCARLRSSPRSAP